MRATALPAERFRQGNTGAFLVPLPSLAGWLAPRQESQGCPGRLRTYYEQTPIRSTGRVPTCWRSSGRSGCWRRHRGRGRAGRPRPAVRWARAGGPRPRAPGRHRAGAGAGRGLLAALPLRPSSQAWPAGRLAVLAARWAPPGQQSVRPADRPIGLTGAASSTWAASSTCGLGHRARVAEMVNDARRPMASEHASSTCGSSCRTEAAPSKGTGRAQQ